MISRHALAGQLIPGLPCGCCWLRDTDCEVGIVVGVGMGCPRGSRVIGSLLSGVFSSFFCFWLDLPSGLIFLIRGSWSLVVWSRRLSCGVSFACCLSCVGQNGSLVNLQSSPCKRFVGCCWSGVTISGGDSCCWSTAKTMDSSRVIAETFWVRVVCCDPEARETFSTNSPLGFSDLPQITCPLSSTRKCLIAAQDCFPLIHSTSNWGTPPSIRVWARWKRQGGLFLNGSLKLLPSLLSLIVCWPLDESENRLQAPS
jgi:hypothetical protein